MAVDFLLLLKPIYSVFHVVQQKGAYLFHAVKCGKNLCLFLIALKSKKVCTNINYQKKERQSLTAFHFLGFRPGTKLNKI